MKSPHGHAIGRVIRPGRLNMHRDGRTFVEVFIAMEDAHQFTRGPYHQKVAARTFREDEFAIVSLLKVGARVRADGDIDWTSHKDEARESFFGQVRISGSITILEEARDERA